MNDLFDVDPTTLVAARELCHAACQWPSRAARANLPAAADDGHSNLGWHADLNALVSHPLRDQQDVRLGFSFAEQALLLLQDGIVGGRLALADQTEATAAAWVDGQLSAAGLHTTEAVAMPYELEATPVYTDFPGEADACVALGRWFAAADVALVALTQAFADVAVSPLVVRCWPHHFDIAVLFALEAGDPETARSVGVGLSPGDGSYAEPYLYCSPWPAPMLEDLPQANPPLSWHTDGFVSVVVPASRLPREGNLRDVVRAGFLLARHALDAS